MQPFTWLHGRIHASTLLVVHISHKALSMLSKPPPVAVVVAVVVVVKPVDKPKRIGGEAGGEGARPGGHIGGGGCEGGENVTQPDGGEGDRGGGS